jgi:hypothetical protein
VLLPAFFLLLSLPQILLSTAKPFCQPPIPPVTHQTPLSSPNSLFPLPSFPHNHPTGQTQSKTEDLKEMGDISSGMSSRVIQIYLKEILNCFLNGDFNVRLMAMRVIEIVLRQGLVHPVQIVPYLICLSTDPETEVSFEGFFQGFLWFSR